MIKTTLLLLFTLNLQAALQSASSRCEVVFKNEKTKPYQQTKEEIIHSLKADNPLSFISLSMRIQKYDFKLSVDTKVEILANTNFALTNKIPRAEIESWYHSAVKMRSKNYSKMKTLFLEHWPNRIWEKGFINRDLFDTQFLDSISKREVQQRKDEIINYVMKRQEEVVNETMQNSYFRFELPEVIQRMDEIKAETAPKIPWRNTVEAMKAWRNFSKKYESKKQQESSESARNYIDSLRDGQSPHSFVVMRPSLDRQLLLESGKLSGFYESKEVGEKKATELKTRQYLEASYLGLPLKQYKKLAETLNPVYGLIAPNSKILFNKNKDSKNSFGTDFYKIRENKVEDKTTFFFTDSMLNVVGVPFQGASFRSHSRKHWLDKKLNFPNEGPMDVFFPWKAHKEFWSIMSQSGIMKMDNKDVSATQALRTEVQRKDNSKLQVEHFHNDTISAEYLGRTHEKSESKITGQYAEIQIWGGVKVNEIESFHFTEIPPSKRFYEFLQENGIKIIDERKPEPVEFIPRSEKDFSTERQEVIRKGRHGLK